jgi:flagellar basal body rod protein FlgF
MKDIETGEINRLSKKEKAMVMTRLTRLKKRYEGIKEMKKAPDGILLSMVTTNSRLSKKQMFSVSQSLLSSVQLVNQNSVIISFLQTSIISNLSHLSQTNSLHS